MTPEHTVKTFESPPPHSEVIFIDFGLTFFSFSFSFSSGGEDGYVRVHYFDQNYFDFEFEF